MTREVITDIDKKEIKGVLIRCKECKHYRQKPTPIMDEIPYGICMGMSRDNKGFGVQIAVTSEHYCSLGERREK